ncbi:MAG TPA: DUF2378 family protein [Chloroflexia bacterium]|nr:DUF2378 family protein [Chloroflexia bacterium]
MSEVPAGPAPHAAPGLPAPRVHQARPPVPDADKAYSLPLDTVFQMAGELLPPGLEAQIRAEFTGHFGKAQPPALLRFQLVDRLALACFPGRSLAAARRLWGRHSLVGYRQSILGRVLLAAIPVMGLERVLVRIPSALAGQSNYGTRTVWELGPQHWRLDFEDEVMPAEMLQGVIEGLAALVHVPDVQVTWTLLAPGHLSYDLIWRPKTGE